MLERRIGSVAITGTIVDIDAVERGWRIVVAPDPLAGLDAGAQPAPPAHPYRAQERCVAAR